MTISESPPRVVPNAFPWQDQDDRPPWPPEPRAAATPEAPKGRVAKLNMTLARRIFDLTKPYRKLMILYGSMIVVAAIVTALPGLITKRLIDDLSNGTATKEQVAVLTGLAVILAFATALLTLGQRWCASKIGEGVVYNKRVNLFDHIQNQPLSFFSRTQTGSLMSRFNNDVMGTQQAMTNTLGGVATGIMTVTVTLVFMFILEWRLTVLILIVFPLFILPARRFGNRIQRLTLQSLEETASMNNAIAERFNVAGALVTKMFGNRTLERQRFEQRAGHVRDISIKSAVYSRMVGVALGFTFALGTAVVYFVGGNMVIEGTIGLGTVAAFIVYLGQIYQPLLGLSNAHVDVLNALVSFQRVFEVLDFKTQIAEAPDARPLEDVQGRIEFDHVWFRHPAGDVTSIASLEERGSAAPSDSSPSDWILHDVSFTVEPGELVALVGPSGAGKTTTAFLVPRLYDATKGAVKVDGNDIREITTDSLRAGIGMVMQDPHLFHDSIEENLRYARPGATTEEIHAACRAARIHDVIASLPEGYGTIVGERGYRLSGGEKQRLSIARMLLKDPAIVILDEATSHLDSESETAIQRALADALRGRTAVVIAHRLSTIMHADRILVLEAGRVVEEGRHDELLRRGGLYASLVSKQSTLPGGDIVTDTPVAQGNGTEARPHPQPAATH